MLRRYKKLELNELLNRAVNTTLPRTLLTSISTLIALLALFIFGGEVIRGFTAGLICGILIGTFSSSGLALPLLSYLHLRRSSADRTSVVYGKSVSVRVDLGVRRSINKPK